MTKKKAIPTKIPADFRERCKKDYHWCERLSHLITEHSAEQLTPYNCNQKVKVVCYHKTREPAEKECEREGIKDEVKKQECITAKVVLAAMSGCNGKRRGANLSGDASSLPVWGSVGGLICLLIVGLLAYWWWKGGDKKGGPKGSGQLGKGIKSRVMSGKSKLGSRKSQASKQPSSRKASQRSKVSKKSRLSGKTKK